MCLQIRLRLSNRQPYVPEVGYTLERIDLLWKNLEATEHSYELWLEAELTRLKNLDHLLRKFRMKVKSHRAWSTDKPAELENTEAILRSSQGELRAMLKRHEAFCSDLVAREARIDKIKAISKELQCLGCSHLDEVTQTTSQIETEWETIINLSDKRRDLINRLLLVLEELDQLHLEFAKKAGPFDIWMQQAEEDLQDHLIIRSTDEVNALQQAHEIFRDSLTEANQDYEMLLALASKADKMGSSNSLDQSVATNPYTHVTVHDLQTHWASLKELEAMRTSLLQTAMQKQTEISRLQEEFAKLAGQLDERLEERVNKCQSIWTTQEGTLESQLATLQALDASQSDLTEQLEALEKCDKALEDHFVFERSKTQLSLVRVRIKWGQLRVLLKTAINQIENQIFTRDSKGLTQAQMDDYRRCFTHFDRDRTQKLEPNEFKALLVSLEYSISTDAKGGATKQPLTTINNNILEGKYDHNRRTSLFNLNDADFVRVLKQADPNGSGYVTFEAFVDFMTREMSEKDSCEQIVEAFRYLAGEKGYVTENDMRRDLTPEDAEYCISKMQKQHSGDGHLDFRAFCKMLFD